MTGMAVMDALAAAARARALVGQLDQSDTDADRSQVAAGVRHELDTVLRELHRALEDARDAATGNRSGLVRSDAPATSQAAARVVGVKAGTQRFTVLSALVDGGPLTDLEIQTSTGLASSSQRPRRVELVNSGLVAAAGIRRHNGMDWTVWSVTRAGRDAWRAVTGIPAPVPAPELQVLELF